MSSAQVHLRPHPEEDELPQSQMDLLDHQSLQVDNAADQGHAQLSPSAFALKQQVAERLANHRARRNGNSKPAAPLTEAAPHSPRAARIAAAVAERYAHSQTYRSFLAAEAEKAIRQAEAAADVAARTAKAVADAQYSLLAELDRLEEESVTQQSAPTSQPIAEVPARALHQAANETTPALAHSVRQPSAGLTVRHFDEISPAGRENVAAQSAISNDPPDTFYDEEAQALDDEIAFRQSPTFEEPGGPQVDIPANLIQFPRQLVAARRARPRLAEGPLREDADHLPETAQLRIFEVEATQISTTPLNESITPEWSSIVLGAHPAHDDLATSTASDPDTLTALDTDARYYPHPAIEVASLELRFMSAAVDGCLVFAGFLAFIAAFALTLGQHPIALPNGKAGLEIAGLGSVAALMGLTVVYQLLFFTFADATPGMRYARIALCTFADDNPTRSAMRRRILAYVLTAFPFGIGILWSWFDADHLSLHDRLSRMYQRSY